MATYKQKLVASKICDNLRKPMGKAMLESGYSKSYSEHPGQLKKTLDWNELMEKYFPDRLIAKSIKVLLKKKEFKGKDATPTGELDPFAVSQGVGYALKLKDKFPVEKHKVEGTVTTIQVIKYDERANNKSAV